MPLFKNLQVNPTTQVLIWKITEPLDELRDKVLLTTNSSIRLQSMKSVLHQQGFLSIRFLLNEIGCDDSDLLYDEYGKPHLKDGRYISITHSFTYTGIIVSESLPVGIDIEKQRDKIVKIAHKFTLLDSYKETFNQQELIRKLTVVWGAKESLYKIYGKKKLLFLHHIFIDDFDINSNTTKGEIRFQEECNRYVIPFLEFDGFTCVYAF